jgi:hypothetical protein
LVVKLAKIVLLRFHCLVAENVGLNVNHNVRRIVICMDCVKKKLIEFLDSMVR